MRPEIIFNLIKNKNLIRGETKPKFIYIYNIYIILIYVDLYINKYINEF
jgi:hypothetical protein